MIARMKLLGRIFAVDIGAQAAFSAVTGIIFGLPTTYLYEVILADYTVAQWKTVFIVYGSLKLVGAPVCRKITFKFRRELLSESHGKIQEGVVDTIASWLYQTPLFFIVSVALGVSVTQILWATLWRSVGHVFVGWSYGRFLNRFRSWFKLSLPAKEEEKGIVGAEPATALLD